MKDITRIERPLKKQVAFMHFLSPTSYSEYLITGERYSRNDEIADDVAIDHMLNLLGHPDCIGKPFLSMFAITSETYPAVMKACRAYSKLYRAFRLDPEELAKRTVIVFNGDVKNLTQPRQRPASTAFVGDEASTAETISKWYRDQDVRQRFNFFSEARLYGPLSRVLELEEYGYPGSDNEVAEAVECALGDEEGEEPDV